MTVVAASSESSKAVQSSSSSSGGAAAASAAAAAAASAVQQSSSSSSSKVVQSSSSSSNAVQSSSSSTVVNNQVIANSGVNSVLHTNAFLLGTDVSDLLSSEDNNGVITFGPGGAQVKNDNVLFHTTRRVNEKANLQTLNNRFAMYTQKVRALEDQNAKLLLDLEAQENVVESSWDEIYLPQIAVARENVSMEMKLKNGVICQRDKFQSQLELWKAKYEQQVIRYAELVELKRTIGVSTKEIEEKIKTEIKEKEEELKIITTTLRAEIIELRKQVKASGEIHVIQCCDDTDIEVELDRMRKYYEDLNKKMLIEITKKKEEQKTTEETTEETEDSSSVEIEYSTLLTRVNSLKMELEQHTFTKTKYEKQIETNESNHKTELEMIEKSVLAAESDYKGLKVALAMQLSKYSELMNTKIGLDMEIATYRKLVDFETSKLAKYNKEINFSNLHKFYAYTDKKIGGGSIVHLSTTEFSKVQKDALKKEVDTAHLNLKPLNISTTKLGTNPYKQTNLAYSDAIINAAVKKETKTVVW